MHEFQDYKDIIEKTIPDPETSCNVQEGKFSVRIQINRSRAETFLCYFLLVVAKESKNIVLNLH